MSLGEVAEDVRRLQAELPEFLELLGNVAGFVGAIDLAKAREVPAEALSELRDALLRALGFLHELFALRGEPPPSPEPGVAFDALGPALRRTLPQRLAAQLDDELNALPGGLLEDISQFEALGLHARVTDLLRFVGYLEQESMPARQVAPPTIVSVRRPRAHAASSGPAAGGPASTKLLSEKAPPRPDTPPAAEPASPSPGGAGPDLSAYDIRIDEAGERLDSGSASAWFASARGPRAAGAGLAASFAVAFPGGVTLAVAEGAESSLGARLAAVVAVRAFCRASAASPSAPEAGVRAAQLHLDALLSALLAAGDASDSLTRLRGSVSPANARRILAHARQPEEALRRIAPALATGLVGAVALASGGGFRVSVLRLGPGLAEARVSGRVAPLFGSLQREPSPFLGPGARGAEEVSRIESAPAVSLAPGDAVLLGTPALAKGAPGAWAGLASLWAQFPDGLGAGDTARDLLRRAERWGEAEPTSFSGPLGFALLRAR